MSLKRSFRLTRPTDFQRVRRIGKSFAHPLIVLIAVPNQLATTRFGVVAGKSVGKAVQRNRTKRLMRAAAQAQQVYTQPGWDIVLIARRPMVQATFAQVTTALSNLLQKAKLLQEKHDAGT